MQGLGLGKVYAFHVAQEDSWVLRGSLVSSWGLSFGWSISPWMMPDLAGFPRSLLLQKCRNE